MTHRDDAAARAATVAIWVAVWLGGLVLAGVGAAIRAAAWTLEAMPRPASATRSAEPPPTRRPRLTGASRPSPDATLRAVDGVLRSSGASLLDCDSPRAPGCALPDGGRTPRMAEILNTIRHDRWVHRQPDRAVRAPGARRLLRHPVARGRVLGVPRHAAAQREPDPAVPRGGPDRAVHADPVRVRDHRVPDHPAAREDRRGLRAQPGRGGPARRGRGDQDLPACRRRVNDEWIICPTCRTQLNRVCANCGRLVGLDWALCAWCGRDFERADLAAYEPIATRRRRSASRSTTTAPPSARARAPRSGRVRQPPSASRGAPGTIPEP